MSDMNLNKPSGPSELDKQTELNARWSAQPWQLIHEAPQPAALHMALD